MSRILSNSAEKFQTQTKLNENHQFNIIRIYFENCIIYCCIKSADLFNRTPLQNTFYCMSMLRSVEMFSYLQVCKGEKSDVIHSRCLSGTPSVNNHY